MTLLAQVTSPDRTRLLGRTHNGWSALLPFAIAYAGGCGLVGALGFYHITQAVAARTAPATPARAIIWLTLFGALSSPSTSR